MSFLEEIKEMENGRNSQENIVLNDILNYFEEKMNKDSFKNNLKERIKEALNKGKNTCDLKIEFWDYTSGCSFTYIYVACCGKFEIKGTDGDYSSYHNYKGVRLEDIHKRVCSKLSELLKEKLKELELKIVSSERQDNKYRYGYYTEIITISW